MTKVLVYGGRDYQGRAHVFDELDAMNMTVGGISLVIHGACMKKGSVELRGADRWAEEWAKTNECPYIGLPAPWTKLGKAAGPHRNGEMIRKLSPDWAMGFPGGNGTADMKRKVEDAGITDWEIS